MDTKDLIGSIGNQKRSTMSDAERIALEELIPTPTKESTSKSLETSKVSWMEEDLRYNRSNPFMSSGETEWIDTLYSTIYPLPGSKRHRETFSNIITNLSLRRSKVLRDDWSR